MSEVFKLRGEQSYSQCHRAGDLLFIAGTVSWDDHFKVIGAGDLARQIETIYRDIGRTVAHFGKGLEAIVRETIYTTDMEALIAANGHRLACYGKRVPPASTWIQISRLASSQLLLEIEAVAAL